MALLGADDLVVLVSLAGDDHEIARPGQADGERDGMPADRARRRSPARPGACRGSAASPASRTPGSMSARMRPGSSVRGLSEVITTRSLARAAAAPISGRLPRSRSPPQPKTVMSAPGVSGRRAVEQPVERVGRVRVVDDHREAGSRDALDATGRRRRGRDARRDGGRVDPQGPRSGGGQRDVLRVRRADQRARERDAIAVRARGRRACRRACSRRRAGGRPRPRRGRPARTGPSHLAPLPRGALRRRRRRSRRRRSPALPEAGSSSWNSRALAA